MKQTTLTTPAPVPVTSTFNNDLTRAFLSANIPLFKLVNVELRQFLEKYTTNHVPQESTLRKNHVSRVFDETMDQVRERIGENFVYISVDETTDDRGYFIANLIIGVLNSFEAGHPYLIASWELERTNASTVCAFVNDALVRFFRGVPFSDKVLLMVTDAAPYMVLAGRNLRSVFNKMVHVTCLAHGLHRICEKVREIYTDVNHLVSWSRKIFLKSPARISIYREIMQCSLPPDVIVSRWGTWLNAASFFANNFPQFSEVIDKLPNDSKHVDKMKTLFKKKNQLAADLAFIKTYLASLPVAITRLETRGLSLNQQIEIVDNVRSALHLIPGTRGMTIKKKADSVFTKNDGFQVLHDLNQALIDGSAISTVSDDPNILSAYTFAPITSVDIERTFSAYKLILTDRRYNFTKDNLEKHLIIMFNSKSS